MKAQELRIGNWINDITGHETQVRGITKQGIWIGDNAGPGPEVAFTPIELTHEWLERFGFECIGKDTDYEMFCIGYREDDSHEGVGSYSCEFELNKNDDGSFHLELSSVEVYHVHQLQNLYFALTNQELK